MTKKFDLTTIYHIDRPLSYSAIASFEWNPGQWHRKYVLKEIPEITPELEFGKMVDEKIQEDPTYLPDLVRYPILQHEMRAIYDGIPLLGYADTFRDGTAPAIRDYKTGRREWSQKRADETGQLTMYLAMLYMMDNKLKPERFECYIDWLPTHIQDGKIEFIKEGDIHTFKTKRTMQQVLAFCQHIKDIYAEMEAYATLQLSMDMGADEFFSGRRALPKRK